MPNRRLPEEPNKRNLRLPRDLAERMKTQALALAMSENTYVSMAVRAQVERDEMRAPGPRPEKREGRGDPGGGAIQGLGLAPLSLVPPAPPAPPPEPTGPLVVVQQGTAPAGVPGQVPDLLSGLLSSITKAPPWERERRMRRALETIAEALPPGADRSSAEARVRAAAATPPERQRFGASPSIGGLFRR